MEAGYILTGVLSRGVISLAQTKWESLTIVSNSWLLILVRRTICSLVNTNGSNVSQTDLIAEDRLSQIL
jgi:hypothetical protein